MPNNEQYLKCGWINPYHYNDPTTPNELAACAIISNLESRSGLSFDFDATIRNEIIADIVDIIEQSPQAFAELSKEPPITVDQLK